MPIINQTRLNQLKTFIPELVSGTLSEERAKQLAEIFSQKHFFDISSKDLHDELAFILATYLNPESFHKITKLFIKIRMDEITANQEDYYSFYRHSSLGKALFNELVKQYGIAEKIKHKLKEGRDENNKAYFSNLLAVLQDCFKDYAVPTGFLAGMQYNPKKDAVPAKLQVVCSVATPETPFTLNFSELPANDVQTLQADFAASCDLSKKNKFKQFWQQFGDGIGVGVLSALIIALIIVASVATSGLALLLIGAGIVAALTTKAILDRWVEPNPLLIAKKALIQAPLPQVEFVEEKKPVQVEKSLVQINISPALVDLQIVIAPKPVLVDAETQTPHYTPLFRERVDVGTQHEYRPQPGVVSHSLLGKQHKPSMADALSPHVAPQVKGYVNV